MTDHLMAAFGRDTNINPRFRAFVLEAQGERSALDWALDEVARSGRNRVREYINGRARGIVRNPRLLDLVEPCLSECSPDEGLDRLKRMMAREVEYARNGSFMRTAPANIRAAQLALRTIRILERRQAWEMV